MQYSATLANIEQDKHYLIATVTQAYLGGAIIDDAELVQVVGSGDGDATIVSAGADAGLVIDTRAREDVDEEEGDDFVTDIFIKRPSSVDISGIYTLKVAIDGGTNFTTMQVGGSDAEWVLSSTLSATINAIPTITTYTESGTATDLEVTGSGDHSASWTLGGAFSTTADQKSYYVYNTDTEEVSGGEGYDGWRVVKFTVDNPGSGTLTVRVIEEDVDDSDTGICSVHSHGSNVYSVYIPTDESGSASRAAPNHECTLVINDSLGRSVSFFFEVNFYSAPQAISLSDVDVHSSTSNYASAIYDASGDAEGGIYPSTNSAQDDTTGTYYKYATLTGDATNYVQSGQEATIAITNGIGFELSTVTNANGAEMSWLINVNHDDAPDSQDGTAASGLKTMTYTDVQLSEGWRTFSSAQSDMQAAFVVDSRPATRRIYLVTGHVPVESIATNKGPRVGGTETTDDFDTTNATLDITNAASNYYVYTSDTKESSGAADGEHMVVQFTVTDIQVPIAISSVTDGELTLSTHVQDSVVTISLGDPSGTNLAHRSSAVECGFTITDALGRVWTKATGGAMTVRYLPPPEWQNLAALETNNDTTWAADDSKVYYIIDSGGAVAHLQRWVDADANVVGQTVASDLLSSRFSVTDVSGNEFVDTTAYTVTCLDNGTAFTATFSDFDPSTVWAIGDRVRLLSATGNYNGVVIVTGTSETNLSFATSSNRASDAAVYLTPLRELNVNVRTDTFYDYGTASLQAVTGTGDAKVTLTAAALSVAEAEDTITSRTRSFGADTYVDSDIDDEDVYVGHQLTVSSAELTGTSNKYASLSSGDQYGIQRQHVDTATVVVVTAGGIGTVTSTGDWARVAGTVVTNPPANSHYSAAATANGGTIAIAEYTDSALDTPSDGTSWSTKSTTFDLTVSLTDSTDSGAETKEVSTADSDDTVAPLAVFADLAVSAAQDELSMDVTGHSASDPIDSANVFAQGGVAATDDDLVFESGTIAVPLEFEDAEARIELETVPSDANVVSTYGSAISQTVTGFKVTDLTGDTALTVSDQTVELYKPMAYVSGALDHSTESSTTLSLSGGTVTTGSIVFTGFHGSLSSANKYRRPITVAIERLDTDNETVADSSVIYNASTNASGPIASATWAYSSATTGAVTVTVQTANFNTVASSHWRITLSWTDGPTLLDGSTLAWSSGSKSADFFFADSFTWSLSSQYTGVNTTTLVNFVAPADVNNVNLSMPLPIDDSTGAAFSGLVNHSSNDDQIQITTAISDDLSVGDHVFLSVEGETVLRTTASTYYAGLYEVTSSSGTTVALKRAQESPGTYPSSDTDAYIASPTITATTGYYVKAGTFEKLSDGSRTDSAGQDTLFLHDFDFNTDTSSNNMLMMIVKQGDTRFLGGSSNTPSSFSATWARVDPAGNVITGISGGSTDGSTDAVLTFGSATPYTVNDILLVSGTGTALDSKTFAIASVDGSTVTLDATDAINVSAGKSLDSSSLVKPRPPTYDGVYFEDAGSASAALTGGAFTTNSVVDNTKPTLATSTSGETTGGLYVVMEESEIADNEVFYLVVIDASGFTRDSGTAIAGTYFRTMQLRATGDITGFTLGRDTSHSWPDATTLQVSTITMDDGTAVPGEYGAIVQVRADGGSDTAWKTIMLTDDLADTFLQRRYKVTCGAAHGLAAGDYTTLASTANFDDTFRVIELGDGAGADTTTEFIIGLPKASAQAAETGLSATSTKRKQLWEAAPSSVAVSAIEIIGGASAYFPNFAVAASGAFRLPERSGLTASTCNTGLASNSWKVSPSTSLPTYRLGLRAKLGSSAASSAYAFKTFVPKRATSGPVPTTRFQTVGHTFRTTATDDEQSSHYVSFRALLDTDGADTGLYAASEVIQTYGRTY